MIWPQSFRRIPDDDWVGQRAETLALTYDTVQDHGWYRNLDPTVERLVEELEAGVQDVVEVPLLERGVDAVASTNAIHLYYDLEDTLRSWREVLRPGGRVFVQSGNIGVRELPAGSWIIDETVEAINAAAAELVREDERYAPYREGLGDPVRRAAYDELRRKFFLPVRPLAHYVAALEEAGFRVERVDHVSIAADTAEWTDFLSAYHEGVLGWVGGSERIEGQPPTEEAVADRLRLLRESVDRVFGGSSFEAVWTYIEAE